VYVGGRPRKRKPGSDRAKRAFCVVTRLGLVTRDLDGRLAPTEMLNFPADLHLELAEILWMGGDTKAAMPLVTSAIGLSERKGNVVSAVQLLVWKTVTIPNRERPGQKPFLRRAWDSNPQVR
jgi:hypothetical protein